jgi:class 3 adenylate cyclase
MTLSRPPSYRKLAAAAGVVAIAVILAAGFLLVERQKDLLRAERVRAGRILLESCAESAVIPLLGDDLLSLNLLVQHASRLQETVFVAVADSGKVIRAHSDPAKAGRKLEGAAGDTASLAGIPILTVSAPIVYKGMTIGSAQMGLSPEVIRREVEKETRPVLFGVAAAALFAFAVVAGAVLLLGPRLLAGSPEGRRGDARAAVAGPAAGPPRGGQNQVTVLCAGVNGFKEYMAGRNSVALVADLNSYFALTSACIRAYGGSVERFEGDTIIGIFESLSFQTDHTKRAIRSALSMVKALQDGGRSGSEILGKVGIGISVGVVLSGNVPSGEGKGNFFIGESLDAACRLQEMANPGEIVISRDVYRSVEPLVSVEPLPPREVVQGATPWENFRLVKIEERESRG